jgi:hypothetical protein
LVASQTLPSLNEEAAEDFMEEGDSGVGAVSAAVVPAVVFAACLRHAEAERLSDRVHRAATGLT